MAAKSSLQIETESTGFMDFLAAVVVLGVLIAIGAGVLWWYSRRLQAATGLPGGEVVYSDTGPPEQVDAPLLSRRYGLVGRPDYLVRVGTGGRETFVPVEVKSGRRPASPAEGHILQLATYCLLVEDVYKKRPAYGLLRYADATLKIPFTDELRGAVLASADAIRRARRAPQMDRSHSEPRRCRACGYREACGEQALS